MGQNPTEDLDPWWREVQSRRRRRRWQVNLPAVLHLAGKPHNCWIHDLSPGGAQVAAETAGRPASGSQVELYLGGYGTIAAEIRYCRNQRLGLEFLLDQDEQVTLARYLISHQPARRASRHDTHIEATLRKARTELHCVVENLSRTGAAIRILEASSCLVTLEEVLLILPGYGSIAATVRHVDGNKVGLMLTDGFEGPFPS